MRCCCCRTQSIQSPRFHVLATASARLAGWNNHCTSVSNEEFANWEIEYYEVRQVNEGEKIVQWMEEEHSSQWSVEWAKSNQSYENHPIINMDMEGAATPKKNENPANSRWKIIITCTHKYHLITMLLYRMSKRMCTIIIISLKFMGGRASKKGAPSNADEWRAKFECVKTKTHFPLTNASNEWIKMSTENVQWKRVLESGTNGVFPYDIIRAIHI